MAADPAQELDLLLTAIRPLLVQYIQESFDGEVPVCEVHAPDDLKQRLNLDLPLTGVGSHGILELIKQTLQYSVRTGHPRFFDKLYCGSEPIGMISELLTSVLNSNIHIYRVSPVFTLMEVSLIDQASKIFGYENADGITCPGGTYSNMLAMLCARNTLFPHTKLEGVSKEDQLVVLTSAEAHYSISKSANALGIGLNNVIKVPTNEHGEMVPLDLERVIQDLLQAGKRPFFLNATSGTTVKGGFDPLELLAGIAKKHKVWFHVDGCWGGSVIFSKKHRHLVAGCQLADSIAWNPHKMLGLPLQMSILFVKEKGLLQQSNALGATYLFRGGDYDLGDKTLQCGRKPDILKLFLTWKYLGAEGFEKRVDRAFENTAKFVHLIRSRPEELELAVEPRGLNICFWYKPVWVRAVQPPEKQAEVLTQLTTRICNRVNERARVMVDFSPNNGGPEFFRMIVNSPHIKDHDLAAVLDEISLVGREEMPSPAS